MYPDHAGFSFVFKTRDIFRGLAAQRLYRIASSQLLESRVIPDQERLLSLLEDRGGLVNIQTATALARKVREMAQVDVALSIVGFPEDNEPNTVIHVFAAAIGKGIEKGFSWQLGGGLRAFQERGAEDQSEDQTDPDADKIQGPGDAKTD
jgi:nicotinamide mononucleotide (NMN) deamidase PncC